MIVQTGDQCSSPTHATLRITEKWWQQHTVDFDSGASRVLGIELCGENPGLARVGYT